jgi:hypothetical protein
MSATLKGLAAFYPHRRETLPDVTVNCYTGGIVTLLARAGHAIDESLIFTLGEGFGFRAGLDEYLQPEIGFDLVGTAARFAARYGCELREHPFPANAPLPALRQLFAGDGARGVIAWANSAHMLYSDLYYSSSGYLHAIVIDTVDETRGLATVTDNLIVSMPPTSCVAELPLEALVLGLTARVSTPHVDLMGSVTTVHTSTPASPIDGATLRLSLARNAAQLLGGEAGTQELLRYAASCRAAIDGADDIALPGVLRRINDMIKTLYVLPSRNLLQKTLHAAAQDEVTRDVLTLRVKAAIESWTILGNLVLKASVTLRRRELEAFEGRVAAIVDAEAALWYDVATRIAEGDHG